MTWRCREAGDEEEAQAAMASHTQDIFTADRESEQSECVYIFRVPSTGEKGKKKISSSNAPQLNQMQQPIFQQVRSSRPRTKPVAGCTCSILHADAVSHLEKTFSPNYQLGDGTAPGSEVRTGGG